MLLTSSVSSSSSWHHVALGNLTIIENLAISVLLMSFLCFLFIAQTHIYVPACKILTSLKARICSFNFLCPYCQTQCFAHRITSKNICWLEMVYQALYDSVLLSFPDSSLPLPGLLFTLHFYCSPCSSPKCSRYYTLPGLGTHGFFRNQLTLPVPHLV